MRPIAGLVCAVVIAAVMPYAGVAQTPERVEKVAEGEYWKWENGHPLTDTAQSWTIWRTKDGFEIESKLPPNKGALLLAAIAHDLFSKASPELQEEARNAAVATELTIELDPKGLLTSLHMGGKSLKDGKPALVADCGANAEDLVCKGRLGSARIKNGARHQLLYSEAGPPAYMPLLKWAIAERNEKPFPLAILREVKNRLQLTEVTATLQYEGPEELKIGEHIFVTEKYLLTLYVKNDLQHVKLWASKQGLVFGVEDSQMGSDTRILLSQYKKYKDSRAY